MCCIEVRRKVFTQELNIEDRDREVVEEKKDGEKQWKSKRTYRISGMDL